MAFTAACAQTAPLKANVPHNLDHIAEIALQASSEGVDLVVFPEGAVTGYFLEGGVLELALTGGDLCQELAQRLSSKLERSLDVAVGFYEKSEGNLYNSCAYIEFTAESTRLVHVYRKFFLPTYGIFDEERFVSRGTELGVFDTRLGKMGILICEDVWHSILPTLCALHGAQAILIPSASPARGFAAGEPDNHDRYRRMLRAVCEEHGVWCINSHLCGFEGGKGFVGGSFVVDPFGKTAAESPILEEHLLITPVDLEMVEIARAGTPLISDLKSSWPAVRQIADRV